MKEDIKPILMTFFQRVEEGGHTTSNFPRTYSALQMKVGFGVGKTAKIPWVAFLAKDQTVTNGIFPVFYFFKHEYRLILAYGVSEKDKPTKTWNVPAGTKTITQYFHEFGKEPHKYGLSYVYTVYYTNQYLDWEKIDEDLKNLLTYYKKIFQAY